MNEHEYERLIYNLEATNNRLKQTIKDIHLSESVFALKKIHADFESEIKLLHKDFNKK